MSLTTNKNSNTVGAVSSPDISVLDFSVLFDISGATPSIILTNASTGPDLAACVWWYDVITPSNTYIHHGSSATPDMTGVWVSETVAETWPQVFNQIEWSGNDYRVILYVKDSANNIFSQEHSAGICRPNGNTPKVVGNFGVASIGVVTKCEQAQVYAQDKTDYTYKSSFVESFSSKYLFTFPPSDTGTVPSPVTVPNASSTLFNIQYSGEGYTIYYDNVRDYDIATNVTVRIRYKVKHTFSIWCNVDLCGLICEIDRLNQEMANNCGANQDPLLYQKVSRLNTLYIKAMVAKQQPLCGFDIHQIIEEIQEVGGFTCDTCVVGAAGINTSNPLGNIQVSFAGLCGDIAASANVVGNNIVLTITDKTYVIELTPEAEAAGWSVSESTDGCIKTYTFDFEGNNDCPAIAPIYVHDTSTPPAECPSPLTYPKAVYSVDDSTILGVANSDTELVAILNADNSADGWRQTFGIAVLMGGCSVAFPCTNGDPVVHVEDSSPIDPPCVDQNKTWEKNVFDFNSPNPVVPALAFPLNYFVSYTTGGVKHPLGLVNSYADLITALNAEPNKPASDTFSAGTSTPPATPNTYKITRFDVDCDQEDIVNVWADVPPTPINDGLIVIGANSDELIGADRELGIFDIVASARIGELCNVTANTIPWHVFQWGNFLYTVESNTGKLYKYDMSDPKNPVLAFTMNLPIPTAPAGWPTAFSGLPQYGGTQPSHWDVYFITDYTDGNNIVYICESTSGCVWEYDMAIDQVTAYMQDFRLFGRVPRVFVNGTIYFSWDGNRIDLLGALYGAPFLPNQIIAAEISTFGLTSASLLGYPILPDTKKPWAISYDPITNFMWVSSSEGDLYRATVVGNELFDMGGGTYFTAFSGVWGTLGTTYSINTVLHDGHIVGSFHSASAPFPGTRFILLSNIAGGVVAQVAGSNPWHYNLKPIPGKNYGILAADGELLKVDLTPGNIGAILSTIGLNGSPGQVYNVVPYVLPNGNTPNSYCP